MELRRLPWVKIALVGLAVTLMTRSATIEFPAKWELANQLHPDVKAKFLALLQAIEAAGYSSVLTSSYRAGGDDPHAYGLALDLNLVNKHSGQQYGMKAGLTTKAAWEATGIPQLIRAHGFRWGGDFITPWMFKGVLHPGYDPVHIDLCNEFPLSVLRPIALRFAGSPANLVHLDKRTVALV